MTAITDMSPEAFASWADGYAAGYGHGLDAGHETGRAAAEAEMARLHRAALAAVRSVANDPMPHAARVEQRKRMAAEASCRVAEGDLRAARGELDLWRAGILSPSQVTERAVFGAAGGRLPAEATR